jgi:hypothetical protein
VSSHARIVQTWPDGAKLHLEVSVDSSYPDAVDEARAQVTRLYAETCSETEDAEGDDA